jgi:hypothetical protein
MPSDDLGVMSRLARTNHLLTARELAEVLGLSLASIFKQARCTALRAYWLQRQV